MKQLSFSRRTVLLLSITALLSYSGHSAHAQSVGVGTTAPDVSAALEIASSTKGLLVPRMNQADREAIDRPAKGLLIFQLDVDRGFWYNVNEPDDGPDWQYLNPFPAGDNLGNQIATFNLDMQDNALIGKGSTIGQGRGIGITEAGYLNIGQNTAGNSFGIGYQAGSSNTTGSNNTFLGLYSGQTSTTGNYNTFAGALSGQKNVNGSQNAFFGQGSGYNSGGNYNAFFGQNSGYGNTTGASNTFLGQGSGSANNNGSQNAFVGKDSGSGNTTGTNNSFLGYGAGSQNATGTNLVAIGGQSGPTTDGLTNAIAIGYQARVSQSNALVLGGTGGNAVSVGIGTPTPTQALEVAGQIFSSSGGIRFPDNTVQLTAAAGDNLGNHTATQNLNLQGTTLVGTGGYLSSSAVGVGITARGGINIGQNTPGNNVYVGYQAGDRTTGGSNTFLGWGAGYTNNTGSSNTFLGSSAGYSNTTGYNNTIIGTGAGYQASTGYNNTFLGTRSGQNNKGNANTYLGEEAGVLNSTGNYQTIIGYQAGANTTAGDNNTFVGGYGGSSNTTGTGNTFLGNSAGGTNTTGTNNLALGYAAGPNTTALTNSIGIGYQAQVSTSNTLVLGGTGTNAVSVAVGATTANPSAVLDLTSTTKGVLLPRLTSTQRTAIASPATGLFLYQTDASAGFYYNAGTAATPNWTYLNPTPPGDNLGNHTATQNLNLQANALIGSGTTLGSGIVGLGVTTAGGLNIGQNNGGNALVGYNTYPAGGTSTNNTHLGVGAGSTSTGSNNTFLGNQAGASNGAGSNNLALGYNASPSAGLTNATAIGSNAIVSQSNALVLGGAGSSAVNVGIGTATPASTLSVVGTASITSDEVVGGTLTVGPAVNTIPSGANTLTINGSMAVAIGSAGAGGASTTAATSLNQSAGIIILNSGTNTTFYALPNSSNTPGRILYIRNNGSTAASLVNPFGNMYRGSTSTAATPVSLPINAAGKTIMAIALGGGDWLIVQIS